MKAESFPIPKPCTVSLREDRSAVLSGNKGDTYPYVRKEESPEKIRLCPSMSVILRTVQFFVQYGR